MTRRIDTVIGTANFLLILVGAATYALAVVCALIAPILAVLALSLWIWS